MTHLTLLIIIVKVYYIRMDWRGGLAGLLAFTLCFTVFGAGQPQEYAGISDGRLGLGVSVENHRGIGSFSVGGLYDGSWEKLTFNYPRPWAGTFMTVSVDGKYYTTSDLTADGVLMDQYNILRPEVEGQSVTSRWALPEGILVLERWGLAENKTIVEIRIANNGNATRKVGIRLQIDTLLGVNDGAPIYVPGSGLLTTEKEYSGSSLNFEYWKAYNRPEEPTIVATGFMDSKDKMSNPSKFVVADWKHSKNSAWDYRTDERRSILGDSAVLLYYDLGHISAGEEKAVIMGYGSGIQVLPEKRYWGLAEVVADRISGSYCPGETALIKADVLNSRDAAESGKVRITAGSNGRTYLSQESARITFSKDKVESVAFNISLPSENQIALDIKAELLDQSGAPVDSKERKALIRLDAASCAKPQEKSSILFLLSLATVLIAAAIILVATYLVLRSQHRVRVSRTINGKNVKITIENRTGEDMRECEVEESIHPESEIDVFTLNVLRKNDKLIWTIGKLEKGGRAVLEYKIKDSNPAARTIVRWDGAQKEYNY